MRALLLKAWPKPLIVGLSLWLGIFGGSWATMRWLSRSIQAPVETVAEVDTRGIALLKREQAVVLSARTLEGPRWTWRGRPAAKLSRE